MRIFALRIVAAVVPAQPVYGLVLKGGHGVDPRRG
jgi:hypothetical protein